MEYNKLNISFYFNNQNIFWNHRNINLLDFYSSENISLKIKKDFWIWKGYDEIFPLK